MALPIDWTGEDRAAVDAVKQAILSGKSRDELTDFEFPMYSPRTGKEARRMGKMLASLDERQWDRLMGVMPPATHPLGNAAKVGEDPRTKENRAAVGACLRLYYLDALAHHVTDRHKITAVGLAISDRMTSQIELGEALSWLNYEHLDWFILLELKYRRGWEIAKIAATLHMGRDGATKKLDAALDYLVERIWRRAD